MKLLIFHGGVILINVVLTIILLLWGIKNNKWSFMLKTKHFQKRNFIY